MRLLARTPAVAVMAACILWVVGSVAVPLLYARLKGWGSYWAFLTDEFLLSLLLLLGPPLLLVVFWRRARGQHPGEGAV